MSKDTGLRPIELTRLKLRDVDLNKGAVYPTTAKHGSPRVLKLKPKTLTMLKNYLATRHFEISDNLFSYWNSDKYGEYFRTARNKIAKKMNNETLKTIRLYDLRHYFATMLYKKTNDLLFVAQQLGHRNIRNTMIYTQLIQFENDDYICKVSQNVERDKELIENGFEYVTERDGLKIYRKRK
jgi:integrase/recombinase XerD